MDALKNLVLRQKNIRRSHFRYTLRLNSYLGANRLFESLNLKSGIGEETSTKFFKASIE